MNEDKISLRWILLLLGLPAAGVFLGLPAAAPPAAKPAPETVAASTSLVEPVDCSSRVAELAGAGYGVRYLIATVPDPIDSQYARLFDLFAASVRRGMEESDYSEEVFCLPWAQPGDRKEAKAGAPSQPLYREQAGWLVFRRDAGSRGPAEVAVVLLVGESPPRGVQAKALFNALDVACQDGPRPLLSMASPDPPAIVTPTFSASIVSLGLALRGWVQERPGLAASCFVGTIQLVTGTATASGNQELLQQVFNGQGPAAVPLSTKVALESLPTSNKILRSCLLDSFLPDRLGIQWQRTETKEEEANQSHAIALLVESSLYGRDFEKAGSQVLVLPFPVHISSLRAEYEKERATKPAAPATAVPTGRELLGLTPGKDADARDAFKVFDLTGTSRTQDLELASILRRITRERVQMVGIAATNIRDTLFLAEALRRYAPDVRLFTFEGDLLLAHPNFRSATQGMIVVSSNPLVEPSPLDSPDAGQGAAESAEEGRVRLQFGTDTSHGFYEAIRRALGDPPGPREVWISVVGNGELMPLQRLRPLPGGETCALAMETASESWWSTLWPLGKKRPVPPPPRGWTLFLVILTVLALFLVTGVTVESWRRRARKAGLGWIVALRTDTGGLPARDQRARHAFQVLIPVVVFLAYSTASGPILYTTHPQYDLIKLLPAAGLLVLVGSAGWLLLHLVRRTRQDLHSLSTGAAAEKPWRRRLRVLWPLAMAVAAIVACLFIALQNLRFLGKEGESVSLVLARMIRFGGGVSPFLPTLVFLSVILGWLLLTLRRYWVLRSLPRRSPLDRNAAAALPSRFWRGWREVRWAIDPAACLNGSRFRLRSLLVCAVFLAVPAVYLSFYYQFDDFFLRPPLRGVEHPWFNWQASLLFLLAILAIIEAGLSLWRGWRAFQRTLGSLAELRLAADEAAPPAKGAPPAWAKEIAGAGRPGTDAEESLLRCRDAAYARFRQALAEVPEGAIDGEDLARLRSAVPPEGERGTAAKLTYLWLAVAGFVAAQGKEDRPPASAEAQPFLDRATSFLAWQTAYLAEEVGAQLVLLLRFLTVGLIAMLAAISLYPFEPDRVLGFYVGALIAAAVAISLAYLWQAEKHPLLSHIAGTDANRVNWHRPFLQRLGFYAALPLASLAASQFPDLQRLLSQLLEPLAKVLQ